MARAYLARGARLWLISRALVSVVLRLAGSNPLNLPPSVLAGIVALAAGLGWAEVMRRHERALLGNLGIHALQYLALVALPALAGEVLFAVAWRLGR